LKERGERYISCNGHKTYDGIATLDGTSRETNRKHAFLVEFQGEIVVDVDTFYSQATKPRLGLLRRSKHDMSEYQEDCLNGTTTFRVNYDEADTSVDEKLAEDAREKLRSLLQNITPAEARLSHNHLELLPHQLPAYILRSRRWG
jgi:hypothetical protein